LGLAFALLLQAREVFCCRTPREQSGTREALTLVRLPPLLARTQGRPEIVIALIDGPIAAGIATLPVERVGAVPGMRGAVCAAPDSFACMHGTLVAGILTADRDSPAPAICPGCTLLVGPIFSEQAAGFHPMPSTSAEELSDALAASMDAGARIVNLSLAVLQSSARGQRALDCALNEAARRGVIIVAAAGNQGIVGGSCLVRHAWVIPVAACDLAGAPLRQSNLGASIGRRGLAAPGTNVTSLGSDGQPMVAGGTSIAAPFVTGTIALLWSAWPSASAALVKQAILRPHVGRRSAIVPPLLDAWGAYELLQRTYDG
jgi:subtilisin family serine protease